MTPTQAYWKNRPVLYRVFDGDGRLIYIGQTINLPVRINEHRGQSWWWKLLADRIQVKLYPSAESAKAAEKVAIQEETPVFNQMGYGNWRDDPYWSDSDHRLYEQWYERVNGRPRTVDRHLRAVG
jgi:predicted GIY-YIG superfamily endonuclease